MYNEYEDKVDLYLNPEVADINKVKADDMNYIKYNLPHISNEVDSSYNTNLIKTKNLCDEIFELGNINDSGVESTSTNTYRSVNYYNVKGGSTLICSYTATTGTKLNWVACYDENKTFITRLTDIQQTAFTLANNVAYIRIGFYKTSNIERSDFSDVMLVYGNTPETYEAFVTNSIVVENEKFTDTLNVGAFVDGTKRLNVLNSKNLLLNKQNSQTINGLTITRNSDGTLKINGTANAQTELYFIGDTSIYYLFDELKAGNTYTYSCVPNNSNNYKAYMTVKHSNNTYDYNEDSGNGVSVAIQSGDTYRIFLRIVNGATLDNIIFSPMIEKGNTKTSYEPYATPSIVVDNDEIYSKGVVLYSSSTGSNGSITLSDNVSNYKYLEIFFDSGSTASRVVSQKVDLSLGTGTSLFKWSCDSSGSVYAFIRDIKISGTTIENFSSGANYSAITYSATLSKTNTNSIYIFKVIGYK